MSILFAPFPSGPAGVALQHSAHSMDVDDEDFGGEDAKLTSPGEPLLSSQAFMRGHGTFVENEDVVASLAGTIDRVNKLVSVRALRSRYNPEVGDLIIGRITEVGPRRWKVDANGRQDAVLMLASINLPGGVQRRKLESDELQMRNFFEEGDLLVTEVQAFFVDGTMSLHTRSLRYGKLRNGQLVTVPPVLVRRLKSHFIALSCDVDLILGLNGRIWVSKHVQQPEDGADDAGEIDASLVYSNQNDLNITAHLQNIDSGTREAIARVSNIIRVAADRFIPVLSDTLLDAAYEWSVDENYTVKELLHEDVADQLASILTVRLAEAQ
ncbi:hypothetical protein BKA62DRAFT_747802 [Auriculariales sp. MPI-PUGE-AT-0066]|nr:hypothetical protein BKA62DRAFT_747802 [Auriculariales sp. MPI-PUGE-AT-0066]